MTPTQDNQRPLLLVGAFGSPYTRKMRAVLRYKRIAYRWIQRGSSADPGSRFRFKVGLIPLVLVPKEVAEQVLDSDFAPVVGEPVRGDAEEYSAWIDSTPIIRALDRWQPQRSLTPENPVLALLDALVEDYGDEWMTKAMFHYRWAYEEDTQKAAHVLAWASAPGLGKDEHEVLAKQFADRQIQRLAEVVGGTSENAALIEQGYEALLEALDGVLAQQPFTLGGRPGAGDMGLFGQLSQLTDFEPTGHRVVVEKAPRVLSWCHAAEDLSGLELGEGGGEWADVATAAEVLRPLLCQIGRWYAPFLLANGAALAQGQAQMQCEIDGRVWRQKAFPYQGRCLQVLRGQYAALSDDYRQLADGALAGTGCEALFA